MVFQLKLLRRTLFARRRGLVRFTAIVAVAGIAAGVASLIVARAIGAGFQTELRDRLLANSAHITIFRADRGSISGADSIKKDLLNAEHIVSANGTATAPAILSGPDSSSYALVTATENSSQAAPAVNGYEAALGVELAANTGLGIGDSGEILVISNGEAKKLKELIVADTLKTGIYEQDATTIKLDPVVFAILMEQTEFTPNQIDVRVAEPSISNTVAVRIRELLRRDLRVIDWQEANQPLFTALDVEQRAGTAVILLILFGAVLNITTTLTLIVAERRHDIAILRSCGAGKRGIISLFLIEGLLVGVIGSLLGVVFGLLICALANSFGVFRLDPQVYSIGNIPLSPTAADVYQIAVAALALCAVASIYPAYRASRIKPIALLRNL